MKSFRPILLIILVAVTIYMIYPAPTTRYNPGILAPDQPKQENLSGKEGIIKDGYLINKFAKYTIDAKILSMEWYYFDASSVLSPVDLALGWGQMSDQFIVDQIDVRQSHRWYYWEANPLPLPRNYIMENSANVHIIPADDYVEDILGELEQGMIVHLEGYLVRIQGPDGFKWNSSLTRTDKGDGACEVFYVEQINIVPVT